MREMREIPTPLVGDELFRGDLQALLARHAK
jgi:hypothetical protein